MKHSEKSLILDELSKLMKKSRLSNSQKKEIINLVKQEKKATEIQKERFMLFYGLNESGKKCMNLPQIAEKYGCTPPAIRCSVLSMRCKLLKYEEEFSIIENIVNECKKGEH